MSQAFFSISFFFLSFFPSGMVGLPFVLLYMFSLHDVVLAYPWFNSSDLVDPSLNSKKLQ
jgi:hypothetical protein